MLRLDDCGEVLQRTVHDGVDVFGVKPLAQRRGPNQVREQNRHHFELLLRCAQCGESGSQRDQGYVHDSVTEDAALRLQRRNSAFELLSLRHDCTLQDICEPAAARSSRSITP